MKSIVKNMNNIFLITTFPDNSDNIDIIANDLIDSYLASCINLLPKITSIYRWNKKTVSSNEVIMVIKTVSVNIDIIKQKINKYHEYEVPEFITVDFDIIDAKYKEWFNKQIKEIK